jgi:PTS system ascorbate-specific IIC component
MRKITGTDDIAFGHGQTLLNMLGPGLASWLQTRRFYENVKIKESFNFLRDMSVSISIIMLLVAFIGAGLAINQIGVAAFEEQISGGQNWFVYTLLIALNFTAGVLVLLQGVRMLIAEITPPSKVSQRNSSPVQNLHWIAPSFIRCSQCPDLWFDLRHIGQVVGMIVLALCAGLFRCPA